MTAEAWSELGSSSDLLDRLWRVDSPRTASVDFGMDQYSSLLGRLVDRRAHQVQRKLNSYSLARLAGQCGV